MTGLQRLARLKKALPNMSVHHTDADRAWAYDRQSSIGRLDKALDVALTTGWTVVDMKRDWNTVFLH